MAATEVTASPTSPPSRPAASRLPDEWAAELERAGGCINGATFDSRLDRFLERFHSEITAARRLKEQLDSGAAVPNNARSALRTHIGEIHRLLAGEGRDFVDGLERREPALALAQQGAGANTLELAHGIERLESAVRAEEAERRRRKPSLPNLGIVTATSSQRNHHQNLNRNRENSFEAGTPHPLDNEGKTLPAGSTIPTALALPNLHSDDTLQLMQSDIHALKLELMRLQRAKSNAAPIPIPTSGSSSITISPDYTSSSTATLLSNNLPKSTSQASSKQLPTENNISKKKSVLPVLPPRPPTHALTGSGVGSGGINLRKMSGLNVTRVGGKPASLAPSYVSHLEEMKSRLDALEKKPLSRAARRKSHARLGRTRTMGSLYDTPALSVALDENTNPNVSSMETPPRDGATRVGNVSCGHGNSSNFRTPGSHDRNNNNGGRGSLNSTPSPAGTRQGKTASRLFIDGPEELLKRPQSYAATRDMQRYSLKVARRFGVDVNQKMLKLNSSASPPPPAHIVEPRSKSAVAHSPRKRLSGLGLPPPNHTATLSSLASAPQSTTSNTLSSDTTMSGGRVVEELEGDLLVRKGVLWKRWRRRYASMVSHQFFGRVLCLFSYDIAGGVNSSRSQIIVLRDGLCKALRTAVDVSGTERFAFVLRTAAKEYYFAADSDEERRKWVSELREAAQVESGRVGSSHGHGHSRLPTQQRVFHL